MEQLHKANGFFCLAYSIKYDNKEKSVLLSFCGSDTCKLSKNLVAPKDIGSRLYAEIKRLMVDHKNPKPNRIAERLNLTVEIVKVTNRFQNTWLIYVVSPNFVIPEQC